MQIRYATKNDILQLSELFRQEAEYHQSRVGYYTLSKDFNWGSYIEDRLSGSKGRILVAEYDAILSGFIYIRIIDYPPKNEHKSVLKRIRPHWKAKTALPIKPMRWGVIEECYVIPDLRRQGIGSRLADSALKWFKVKKVHRVELSTPARNEEAERFWRKLGFETFRLYLSRNI